MRNINKRIQRLKNLLEKNRGKSLFVTLIYKDGSERRMESNKAFFALDGTVVDYRWEDENALSDDNFLGAILANGPFDIRNLFENGDDSEILPDGK